MNLDPIYRGDTIAYTFNFQESGGTSYDISNMTLWFTIKTNEDDPDASAVLQDNVTFPADTNSANGIGYLTIAASSTDINPGTYYFDFQLVNGTTVTTLGKGTVSIIQDITVSTS